MNRQRRISVTSRTVYRLLVGGLVLAAIVAFLGSRIGQTALLVCCGGLILLAAIGIMSEMGMRRPR